jgi:hypothetical protein
MAKPKGAGAVKKIESKPKRTRQGDSVNSKPNHGRKKSVGQGK